MIMKPMSPMPLGRRIYRARRAVVRLATYPARPLREGIIKNRVRSWVLRFQNSLPTELAVNAGDIVVQVGTPYPRTMLRFVRAIGNGGRLVIVEAMPANYERLQSAVNRYHLGQVSLVHAAACNENRMGTLAVSPIRDDHKIPLDSVSIDNDERPENAAMTEIPVRFVRLDDVLADLGVEAVDYLSVTVNGAEAEVLKGASETLRRGARWSRVYAKGHAIGGDGRPIHEEVGRILSCIGFKTLVTHGEPSFTKRRRSGDIYAWKP